MISSFMGNRYLWLFKALRKSQRCVYNQVPNTDGYLNKEVFNGAFLSANRALMIRGGLQTINKWTMDTLKTRIPDCIIEILNHRNTYAEPDKYKQNLKQTVSLHRFIDLLNATETSNDFYSVPFNKNEESFKFLIEDIEPIEILETIKSDNAFIWLGPKGTITPWHYDLQNILMGQLIGRKRVLLIPSWDFPMINNNFKTFGGINYTEPIKNPSLDEPQIFDVTLEEGDLLFIPVGWSHYVEGLEKSLTLSFTGFTHDNNYYSFFNGEL